MRVVAPAGPEQCSSGKVGSDPALREAPSRTAKITHVRRSGGILPWARTVVSAQEETALLAAGPVELKRRTTRSRSVTTNWAGRIVADTLHEVTVVRDHLGRLHSARVASYERGQLVSEAAALYVPQGLAGKAVSGTAAASLAVGAVGAAAMAGLLGAAAQPTGELAGASCAVGYVLSNGRATYGVLLDPEAVGLPPQRSVDRAALERVRPPPWQRLPAAAVSAT